MNQRKFRKLKPCENDRSRGDLNLGVSMFAELSFSGHMRKKLLSVVARGSLRWFQLQKPKTKPRIIAGANKCKQNGRTVLNMSS